MSHIVESRPATTLEGGLRLCGICMQLINNWQYRLTDICVLRQAKHTQRRMAPGFMLFT